VALVLRDTGIGMPPEVRSRIFEPFFTTKPTGEGSGLGLATVYGIVSQSAGQIEVESAPGQGTCFYVFFPRVDALPQAEAAAAPAPPRERRSETVLLAEDDAAVREALRRSLEARGFEVLAARHGEEALALCRGHTGPIHLLLTDVVMPRIGGRELAARLRAERPGIRVLYLSGYSEELSSAGELAPGEAFLQKPCAGPRLLAAVEALLDAPGSEASAQNP
jgi:CheY-like chemotaxis protein